jgi:hypothetical protein
MSENTTPRFCVIAVLWLIAAQAILLHMLGQSWVSETHSVMLWAGDVLSQENSQQLMDWYTFSHVIHGLVFYLILWFFFPRLSVWHRFALAVATEAAWEVFENTPMVIDHYRQQALAQGYFGDSILNSISDTVAMIVGFVIAWRLPVLAAIAIGIIFELWVGYWIHDGLLLNIIGFVWTPDFVANWQQS